MPRGCPHRFSRCARSATTRRCGAGAAPATHRRAPLRCQARQCGSSASATRSSSRSLMSAALLGFTSSMRSSCWTLAARRSTSAEPTWPRHARRERRSGSAGAPDRSAELLVGLPESRSALHGQFTAQPDGTFIGLVRNLTTGTLHTVSGKLAASGLFTASAEGLGLVISATRTPAGPLTAGIYHAAALNGFSGAGIVIASASGQVLAGLQRPGEVELVSGTLDAAGQVIWQRSAVARTILELDARAGRVSLTDQRAGAPTLTLAGHPPGSDPTRPTRQHLHPRSCRRRGRDDDCRLRRRRRIEPVRPRARHRAGTARLRRRRRSRRPAPRAVSRRHPASCQRQLEQRTRCG